MQKEIVNFYKLEVKTLKGQAFKKRSMEQKAGITELSQVKQYVSQKPDLQEAKIFVN